MYGQVIHTYSEKKIPVSVYDGKLSVDCGDTCVFRYGHPLVFNGVFQAELQVLLRVICETILESEGVAVQLEAVCLDIYVEYVFHADDPRVELPSPVVTLIRDGIEASVRTVAQSVRQVQVVA